MRILTIGGYGFSEEAFFKRLREYHVDTFVDVRRRRGMRGSRYAFLNSIRLQDRLKAEGIRYVHAVGLAPTQDIREAQKSTDRHSAVKKSDRLRLSDDFVDRYKSEILDRFSADFFKRDLQGAEVAALFCVEGPPTACHRSLAADHLVELMGVGGPVEHLRP